jgi:hypothetical protein
VAVCNRRYLVNAKFIEAGSRVDPNGPCPAFVRPTPEVFAETPGALLPQTRVVAVSPKTRNLALESTYASAISNPVGFSRIPANVLGLSFATPSARAALDDERNEER